MQYRRLGTSTAPWRRLRTRSVTLAATLLGGVVAGCASAPPAAEDWPRSVPPRANYEQLHALDAANGEIEPLDDYLVWVTRFYEGWGPFPYGWNAMSEAALEAVPEERYALVAAKLDYLGQLISGEWAKSRARTRIPNRALAAWAQAMNEAIERGEVEALLDRAIADVERVLAGDLDGGTIRIERYYPDLDLEA